MDLDELEQLHLQAARIAGIERSCGKKQKFIDKDAAHRAAIAHNKWENRKHDVEPYPCPFCLGWHIGGIMPEETLKKIIAEHESLNP